jgi:hypothetical protein
MRIMKQLNAQEEWVSSRNETEIGRKNNVREISAVETSNTPSRGPISVVVQIIIKLSLSLEADSLLIDQHCG